jgi:hypothetical protein
MFAIVRGLLKLGLLGAVLVVGGGGYGYYRYAAGKLPAAEGEVVYTARLCRTTPSLSGGTLPFTFEAYPKALRAHNFYSGGGAGLVSARFEWSHGSQRWVRDLDFEARQRQAADERKKLAERGGKELIDDLASLDAERREIAAKELYLRTGETLGYRYDAPEPEREEAIRNWKEWWSKDENRLKAGARRAIDAAQRALEALKRALGEPEERR